MKGKISRAVTGGLEGRSDTLAHLGGWLTFHITPARGGSCGGGNPKRSRFAIDLIKC